ncbi:MAG: hypothetical protein AVDCRST_MAG33-723, partial [uncultured Thermomicrobiales bacterium]
APIPTARPDRRGALPVSDCWRRPGLHPCRCHQYRPWTGRPAGNTGRLLLRHGRNASRDACHGHGDGRPRRRDDHDRVRPDLHRHDAAAPRQRRRPGRGRAAPARERRDPDHRHDDHLDPECRDRGTERPARAALRLRDARADGRHHARHGRVHAGSARHDDGRHGHDGQRRPRRPVLRPDRRRPDLHRPRHPAPRERHRGLRGGGDRCRQPGTPDVRRRGNRRAAGRDRSDDDDPRHADRGGRHTGSL